MFNLAGRAAGRRAGLRVAPVGNGRLLPKEAIKVPRVRRRVVHACRARGRRAVLQSRRPVRRAGVRHRMARLECSWLDALLARRRCTRRARRRCTRRARRCCGAQRAVASRPRPANVVVALPGEERVGRALLKRNVLLDSAALLGGRHHPELGPLFQPDRRDRRVDRTNDLRARVRRPLGVPHAPAEHVAGDGALRDDQLELLAVDDGDQLLARLPVRRYDDFVKLWLAAFEARRRRHRFGSGGGGGGGSVGRRGGTDGGGHGHWPRWRWVVHRLDHLPLRLDLRRRRRRAGGGSRGRGGLGMVGEVQTGLGGLLLLERRQEGLARRQEGRRVDRRLRPRVLQRVGLERGRAR
mmetsp:Transcript_68809/g.188868  ORF Transcript_68809/g.188868 Transcript_68809/m.188868 type:complete len:353 (-) Transcript_68809:58-1116(-)